jgi:DNA-binding response OmpR family regulator
MMSKILVVEDNLALAEGLAYNLRHEGHDVRIAEDGEAAVADSRAWSPDLVILDLMLPRLDGYGVLAAIRESKSDVPVIILSARGEEADKVRGFRLDADQYVTKPFGVLELLERVSALLRRKSRAGAAHTEADTIRFGDVVVDVAARTVCRGGVPCTITPKAYELLLALVARGGRVATRQDLLKEVWGYGAFVLSRTVDSHIAELRRKLEVDPARPRHIVTVWKVGYRFETS